MYLMDDSVLIVPLDLQEHIRPGPVSVMVLQSGHCHQNLLKVLETYILTLFPTARMGKEGNTLL